VYVPPRWTGPAAKIVKLLGDWETPELHPWKRVQGPAPRRARTSDLKEALENPAQPYQLSPISSHSSSHFRFVFLYCLGFPSESDLLPSQLRSTRSAAVREQFPVILFVGNQHNKHQPLFPMSTFDQSRASIATRAFPKLLSRTQMTYS
jgi:hypothetical protein